MDTIFKAFALISDPQTLGIMLLAAVFGLFVGAIPGLTATMATALLIPFTFFLDPVPAIAIIVTAVATAIFAGDIPGALLRIPGTPASAAYCDESYAMTKKGQGEQALGIALVTSVIGGLVGSVVLAFSAPALAEFAIQFSSYEYFWLACLGLSCAVIISTGSTLKGFVSLFIGLFIATVGIDGTAGHPRFTFGNVELMGGVSFIPAMIGMFAISEVLRYVASNRDVIQVPLQKSGSVFAGLGPILRKYKFNIVRGSSIGAVVGILPGAGADIAAWISFAISKKRSKTPEKFGTGHPEGLVDAGAANNASLAGAWVPATVFGIPGDSITAIAIGVLYMKGMNPGPMVFIMNPELIYAVFLAFFMANLALLPLGFVAIKLSRHILRIPRRVLMPIIVIFCMVGAFAINNTVFGISVMLVLGVLAYLMEENGFPVAPAILGIVLGNMVEDNFMASMIKADGDPLGFFSRPIAATLGVITILVWLVPLVKILIRWQAKRRQQVS
ncbi:tripartite tricarboxylate transporter permease [Maliponia aquimaris]|uniref:Tripartite tricarboxylate transporter TctA family protein n=1 Tax=Maliponia aquimaris TaxID=1673631 RepID=A0A238KZ67_9RHOB|nr:tripartite tricarboxylate transporter permease [Maliponia aquimaris]SMX47871.1 Tripartite tricarboxylate transporter TctA family protein [Maliponia aquimaris]